MNEMRQPKGIPAGGQFAATAHAEAEAPWSQFTSASPAR
jgi:hypothetical protein